jgi:hypothetical protein
MSDQTHYAGCWEDPRHHACALREIERLRQRDETPRCPQCETLRLEAGSMRAEIERLRGAYEQERQDCINLTEKVIPNLREEIERLRGLVREVADGYLRATYGSSHEDVAQVNDLWRKVREALQ